MIDSAGYAPTSAKYKVFIIDEVHMLSQQAFNGLLKTLDIKTIIDREFITTNTEAYEYYLKGRHTFQKRRTKTDIEIAKGLLQNAIKLDKNLIRAEIELGWV